MQGGEAETAAALGRGELAAARLDAREQALLELVEKVTRAAWRLEDADVARVAAAGWSQPEIAEAVYVTALFAFYNRIADAFGLKDPGYRELAQRTAKPVDPRERR